MLKTSSSLRHLFFTCSSSSRTLSTRRLVYETRGAPEKVLKLETIELPDKLESEQVLVEWNAGVVNPSDLNQIQGTYRTQPKLPAQVGMDGVGTVAKVGSSVKSLREGDRVICEFKRNGTWAEHGLYRDTDLIPIDKNLPVEDAMFIKVNPMSAYIMLKEYASLNPGDYVLQNCANSAVGQLVIQMSRILGFKTINVVRNRPNLADLVKELKALGADEVITEEELFDRKRKVKLPRVKLALNGVGGKSSLHLAARLQNSGCMVTYGGMSKESVQSPTAPLIFDNISLRGFWLFSWSEMQKNRGEVDKILGDITGWMKSGEIVKPAFQKRTLDDYKATVTDAQTVFDRKQVFFMKQ